MAGLVFLVPGSCNAFCQLLQCFCYLFINIGIYGKFFARVQKEQKQPGIGWTGFYFKRLLLQPVGFAQQALNAVSVYRFFKVPAAGAYAAQHLRFVCGFSKVQQLYGTRIDAVSGTENLLQLFTAFEALPAWKSICFCLLHVQ